MRSYQYTPLPDPAVDIRLVNILPGEYDDDVYLDVLHVPLERPRSKRDNNSRRMTLQQLRKTVPPGWLVRITTEGRYMFNKASDVHQGVWQWEHPDPTFDRASYELVDDPDLDDQSPLVTPTDGPEMAMPPLRYEALSYTWNSGIGQDEKIFMCGPSLSLPTASRAEVYGAMTVGQSLIVALRHLRRRDRPRRMWIDALCINQSDDSEKGHQVGRMADIFQFAHRVVCFLDPAADGSGHALSTLRYLGQQVEVLVPSIRVASPGAAHPDWVDRDTELPYDAATWDAIHALLSRKWFTRLWIIQESRLAGCHAIIQAGPDVVSLSLFRRAVKCLRGKNRLPVPELRTKLEYVQLMTDDQTGLPFCAVLDMGYGRGCANPRDRIYGLLGIAPPRLAAKVRPQYGKGVAEVMRDAMLTHSRHCLRLELLKRCCQAGRTIDGLPSWVPDLTSGAIFNLTRSSDFATGHSRAHFGHRPPSRPGDDDVLEVLGLRCATVTEVSAPLLPGSDDPAEVIRSWQPADVWSSTYAPTGEPLGKVHAITLRTNIFRERYRLFKCTDVADWVRVNAEGEIGLFIDGVHGMRMRAPPWESYVYGRAYKLCMGKTYVRTREGYVGLAPAETKPGDIIAILLGCDSPILLRPTGDCAEQPATICPSNPARNSTVARYKVLGQCFVYGLHDGIALLGPLPEPWRVELSIGYGNRLSVWFVDGSTGKRTREDPRLANGPAPLGPWERCREGVEHAEPDDPEDYDYFRNKDTGEVVNSDPRLTPEALAARGVVLDRFALV